MDPKFFLLIIFLFLPKLTYSQIVDEDLPKAFEEIFGDGTIDEKVNVYDHISSSVEDLIKLFHHETILAEKLEGTAEAKLYIDEIKQRYSREHLFCVDFHFM